ncbi:MAG: sulfite exporter TauE/SafE family protein [Reinekea sp.]|jgi:uncharacterized protein
MLRASLPVSEMLMFELSPSLIAVLVVTGFLAGIINILAGGGSNLTLPALMLLGLPADMANATNRVGVFMQSIVGIRGFAKHKKLPTQDLKGILLATLSGGLIGSVIASLMPNLYLKPLLLGAMISMALVILVRPSVVLPGPDESIKKVSETPPGFWMLFLAGIYGGFVQAGVGFILIAAIAGTLRYELVQTNALKVLCTFAFTSVALVVFVFRGQVAWVPSLILGLSTMAGASIGVRLALNVSPKVMKWFLFVMTVVASIAALIK